MTSPIYQHRNVQHIRLFFFILNESSVSFVLSFYLKGNIPSQYELFSTTYLTLRKYYQLQVCSQQKGTGNKYEPTSMNVQQITG